MSDFISTDLDLRAECGIQIKDSAGLFTATTIEGALAELGALKIGKRTVTVADEDLTGSSKAVNVGTILPTGAIVLAHELNITEQFAGEADTTITLGGTDADAIVASTDLDAMGVANQTGTLGVHPRGSFSAQQLVATFAATALADLTAGSVTITVWFAVVE